MAFVWADSSDRVVMSDNAVLTLPDADWSVCCLIKFSSRAGTSVRNLCRYASASGLFEPRIGDASSASHADDIQTLCTDDDGTNVSQNSTSNPFASNTSWNSIVWVRSGTTVTTYCNGSSLFSNGNINFDAIDGGNWKFGNNVYDSVPFMGSMCEWAKWDRALTADEITALGGRNNTAFLAPTNFPYLMKWYVPMIRDYREMINNLTVTNTGTDVGDHAPVIYPSYTLIGKTTSAAAQTITLTGLSSTEAIGTQSILLNITANGIASVEAIGSQVVANTQILSLTGLSSSSALGSPSLGLNIDLSGILNSQAFGSSVLVLNVNADGIASINALGSPSIGLNITATGLENVSALGSPTLSYEQTISLLGIPSTSVVGTHIIADTLVIVTTGLDSTTTFGTPILYTRNFEVVTPTTGDFVRVDV